MRIAKLFVIKLTFLRRGGGKSHKVTR